LSDAVERVTKLAQGRVKWFDTAKGYGFIMPDDGGKDVFVHLTEVQKAGYTALVDGAAVTFDIVFSNGKPVAGNLQLP
jgi:CspA family cold shock protein